MGHTLENPERRKERLICVSSGKNKGMMRDEMSVGILWRAAGLIRQTEVERGQKFFP